MKKEADKLNQIPWKLLKNVQLAPGSSSNTDNPSNTESKIIKIPHKKHTSFKLKGLEVKSYLLSGLKTAYLRTNGHENVVN